MSHVGGKGKDLLSANPVAHALVRVVGRVKSGHIQLTQGEALVYRDNVKAELRLRQAAAKPVGDGAGRIDRQGIMLDQHFQP